MSHMTTHCATRHIWYHIWHTYYAMRSLTILWYHWRYCDITDTYDITKFNSSHMISNMTSHTIPWCHWRYCDITDDIMTSYSDIITSYPDIMTSYAHIMTSYVFNCSVSWIWTRWTRKQYWVWWGHGTCVVPAYARGRLGLTWVELVKWFCWSKFGLHVSGFIAVKLWVLFCLESFCQKATMLSFCGPVFFLLPDFLISSPIFWIFGCWKMWGPPI